MVASTAEIWNDFSGRLRGFIRGRVGSDQADDVLQDAFIRIHRSLERGEVPRDPTAWVYKIARTTVIDHYRAQGVDRSVPHPDPGQNHMAFQDESPDVTARAELAACVQPLIEGLDPTYREALTWTGLEGMSQTAAASRAGISVSGMKSRVQRGRRQLADRLLACCEVSFDRRGAPMESTPICKDC